MQLTCPSCHTRYLVPDAALGAEGRNVRCVRCKHEWKAHASAESLAAAATLSTPDIEPKPIPPGSGLPTEPAPRRGPSAMLKAAAILLPLLALLLAFAVFRGGILQAAPALYSAYDTLGIARLPVVLAEVKSEGEQGRFILGCTLANPAGHAVTTPRLRMQLVTQDGEVLAGRQVYAQQGAPSELPAGGRSDCGTITLDNPFRQAHALVLDIGSHYDLLKRETPSWNMSGR